MEFGKHLGKGVWGLADKALPVVYGLGYVFLVIRVLPEEEFGNWTLLQEIFLLLSGLVTAFGLNPLVKFAAEDQVDTRGTVTVAVFMQGAFVVLASALTLLFRNQLGSLMHSGSLGALLVFLPLMLLASFIRNLALVLLQARFRMRDLFVTDAAHFLGAPFLTWVWSRMHAFNEANDLVLINIISLSCSSLVGLLLTWRNMTMTWRPSPELFRKVWSYGLYSLGGSLSALFSARADSFILAAFTGPIQVAVYNSVKIFIRAYDMVQQVIQMFLLPATSRISSRGDSSSLKVVVEKSLLFGTVGMIPIFAGFLVLADPLIRIVYQGRYLEAVPQLRMFGLIALFVPTLAIASNVVLGIGEARAGFLIGLQSLGASIVFYLLLIPLFGVSGATLAYVLAFAVMTALTMRLMRRHVASTLPEVLRRWRDIDTFVRVRFWKLFGRVP